jgi:glycosyltransferase involved in cell wall biosynthesis
MKPSSGLRQGVNKRPCPDKIISAYRAVRYAITEKIVLRLIRLSRLRYREDYQPLVTCYIPTHNRATLLLFRGLASVRKQKYDKLEIIVAAHGCTDQTHAVVRQVMNNDPRVKLLIVPRTKYHPQTAETTWLAGAVEPANAAFRAATGEWIARCDDDDIWTEDHIQRLLYFAVSSGYEFVSSAYEREVDGKREVVPHDGEHPPIGGTQTWLMRSYLTFMKENPDCWRKAWNRVSDTDYADRIRKAGVRTGWIEDVTAYVLPRPGETKVGLAAVQQKAKASHG